MVLAQLESDDKKTVEGKHQDDTASDNTEKARGLTRSSSLVQLLHRPPRLGLSRLQKKVHNLHQIVPSSEKEE